MIQIIQQSKYYKVRPSEMMAIRNDWLAYCFDEVCLYLTSSIYDSDNYTYNWENLMFEDSENINPNQSFINFIREEGGKYD